MIQGQKTKLIAFEPDHWHYIGKWMSDPYYKYYFRNIPDVMTIAQLQAYPQVLNMNVFMIINEANEVVGMCTWDNVRILARTCCIGFLIDKEHSGKGYGKDSYMEFCHYLTQRLGLHKLTAKMAATEVETIGKAAYGAFTDEVLMRDEFFMDGKWHNEIWMSILDTEFAKQYEIYKAGKMRRDL